MNGTKKTDVIEVNVAIHTRYTLPVSGTETHQPAKPQNCGGLCSTCRGDCRVAAEPTATGGCHSPNSLRQAGEILLKMVAGQYPTVEEKDLWETLESLLRSYAAGKGASNG